MAYTYWQQRDLKAEHEKMRRELWCNVAARVAGVFNCKRRHIPAEWADQVLKDFDKRFPY